MRASNDGELQAIKKEALRIYRFERDEYKNGRGPKPNLREIVEGLLIQDYGREGLQYLQKIMTWMSERSQSRRIHEIRRALNAPLRETPAQRPKNEQLEFSDFEQRPRRVA